MKLLHAVQLLKE